MKSTTQIQIFKDLSQNGETIVTSGAGVVAGGAGEKKREEQKMTQINQLLHAPPLASLITAIERIQIGSARCLRST